MAIQRFRKLVNERMDKGESRDEIVGFINDFLYVDRNAAEAIYSYFHEQHSYTGIPNESAILIEGYADESNRHYSFFHTLYGRRVNDALARAVAFAIGRSQHMDVEMGINDNGFYISGDKKFNAKAAFKLLKSEELEKVVQLAIANSEVLKRRFRHCAERSLMILRQYKGNVKRAGRQQVSSMLLLSSVRRISEDFPILKEARREVLEDLMDVGNAVGILKLIESKRIKVKEVDTKICSPFAFNLLAQGYSDIFKMEDRMEFLRRMHQLVLAKISLEQGKRSSRK